MNAMQPPQSIEEIKAGLETTEKGGVRQSIRNCLTVFQRDPLLSGAIAYNILTDRKDIIKPIGFHRESTALNDTDMKYLLLYLEETYGLTNEKKIDNAIGIVANENKYHPIRDYLNTLVWDGTERIRFCLRHFLGADADDYTYEALKLFLLGAISRAFQPGCKFEIMLCLVGGQGAGKSTFFRLLAVRDEWFSDDLRKLDDDNVYRKAKSRLYFDKVEKAPPQLKPNPASRPIQEAGLYLHGKIHEVEHENVGVEGGHKGEELAERQAGRMIRSGVHRHKLKPYRAAAKAERKSIAANAEFVYQKSMRNNPELAQVAKNPVSRFWQKQHIKREYAKAARAAGQTAQGAASTAKTTAAAAKKAAEKSRQAASFAARHWKGALIVGGVGLMLLLVMGGLQSCTAMFGSTGTGLAATSYLSEDSDMLGAEAAYAALEADLQHELDNYESLHPGYDEYRFDLDEIKHDPYVLTSILSALHNGVFTLGEVQGDLAMLFEKQYILTQTIETETRYRTETRTDSEGNTYTVEVPYTYYICNVKLENFDLSHLPIYILTEEQMGFYAAYMQTLGNRPDLFPNGSYPHASTPKEPTYYEIPPEALKDEAFAAMIAEAEKYVGYPYVWGGSSPSTSFDCSGFISWVINHSGWNVGRQTAQGLYNICTPVSPEQAKPGDLVFFVGTYDTAGMSHVGLYVGNSVMLHCGDPISYTNLNSSYWQQHFYCYGRLP